MATYADILTRISSKPAEAATDHSKVASVFASIPAAVKVDVERFRSVTTQMQSVASQSIKQEIERIIALPIVLEPTPEEIRAVSDWYITNPSPALHTLLAEQVAAMMQFHDFGGLVCPVKVGGGKTLISVLIANDAYTHFGKRRILLMDPPHLIDQLRSTELPFYRRHISINVPFYWLAGSTAGKRKLAAKSKRAGCYVVSYSLLSGPDGAEILNSIEPDLIIGDEIHSIASANPSARGRRFKEVVKKFAPQIVGLSGTITKKSPRDYHFLVTNALQERAFIPRPSMLADEWAKILDTNASSLDQYQQNQAPQPGPIRILIDWAKRHYPNEQFPNNLMGFRGAFKKRMETCPGVIASEGEEGGVSARMSNIKVSQIEKEKCPGWNELQAHIKKLEEEWVAPNGDEIDHQIHMWQWIYCLEGFGFYNNLTWPVADRISEVRGISLGEAQDRLERSKIQHTLQQDYAKELRKWIKNHAKRGLDTPFLIGGDMAQNGSANVGGGLFEIWRRQKEACFPEMIQRTSSVVKVCDFRVKAIVDWAKQWYKERPNKAAIVWYCHNGVGRWLKEYFEAADLPTLYCPAGNAGKNNLADRTKGNCFAIASFKAYSDGLNLQYHHDAECFAQWPREAYKVHQAIGRVRRTGQDADEIRIFQSICSEFDRVLFAACLNDAAYIHQTSARHNLLMMDYDERPAILPYSVLLQWGTEAKELSSETRQLLEDKFLGDKDVSNTPVENPQNPMKFLYDTLHG